MPGKDDRSRESGLERARQGALDKGDRLQRWDTLAERRIREAMKEGAFDNLRGRGRPLDLRENPYVDPATRLGHQLLRNNGYTLPWIDRARDLRTERAAVVARIGTLRSQPSEHQLAALRDAAADLNRRIRDHNLTVPVPGMAVRRLDLDAELQRGSGKP